MFENIRKGLKNFAHNLINTTHSLFITGLFVNSIVACVFFAFPVLPVLFYGFVAFILGAHIFSAAHKIVDFFATPFNKDGVEVEVATPVANTTKAPAPTSTSKMQTAFAKNPAPTKAAVVDANTQTETKVQVQKTIREAVAANYEEQAQSKVVSFR